MKFSVSSWLNFIIGFVAVYIMTRLFTPELYGIINLYNNASNIIAAVATLGLNGAFMRFYYEENDPSKRKLLFSRCILISVLFCFFVSIISIWFFYYEISIRLFRVANIFLVILLFINALSILIINNYFSAYYRISKDVYHYTIQQILFQLSTKLLVMVAVFITPTIENVVLVNTIGTAGLMIIYVLSKGREIIDIHIINHQIDFLPVLKFGICSTPTYLMLQLNNFMIPLLISMELGAYELGVYSSAAFFVAGFNVLQGGFRTYWSAFMYEHYKDRKEDIINAHNYVMLFIVFVLGMIIIFQDAIYLIIGEKYHESKMFFSLVLLDPMLTLLEQTTVYGINLAKKNYQNMINFIIGVSANVLFTVYFLKKWGLIGVAVASALSIIIRFILSTWRGQIYYRSFASYKKTIVGTMIITLLAGSNFWLYEEKYYRYLFVLIMYICVAIIYRKDCSRILQKIQ